MTAEPPVATNSGLPAESAGDDRPDAVVAPWRDPVFLAILAATLTLRVYLAFASPYIWDEQFNWIPASARISIQPGNVHLPIRETQHSALTSYLIRIGSGVFGENAFGFRFFSLLAGVVSVVLIYRLGFLWRGRATARWAAFLLAFNEYHLAAGILAVENGPYLMCVLLTIYALARFLQTERPGWLYAAAAWLGAGFLLSELAFTTLLFVFVTLLALPHRRWLIRKEPWLALALLLLIISPDLCHNLFTAADSQSGTYAGYGDHLSRFGGIGFSAQPLIFFFRYALEFAGIPYRNEFSEMPAMNQLFSLVLLAGVVYMTLRRGKDFSASFFLILFYGVLVFFSLIVAKAPDRKGVQVDEILGWNWVDVTLFPAVLLTACALSRLRARWRAGAYVVAAALAVYVCVQVVTLQMWRYHLPNRPAAAARWRSGETAGGTDPGQSKAAGLRTSEGGRDRGSRVSRRRPIPARTCSPPKVRFPW